MEKIGILGAGMMGAGIAQLAALGGYDVILRDLQMTLVNDGLKNIENNLEKMAEKGFLNPEEKLKVINRIKGTVDLSELRDTDLVIEAVVENIAVKKQIFTELDHICPEHTILASNTSSLSITEIATSSRRSDRVLGMHFLNPQMKLVEVVKGLETSDDTVNIAREFLSRIGRDYVIIKRESPGYIVNRIMVPCINEAICIYGDGLADKESIDTAMKLGAGMPQGPLELADIMGLDNIYAVLQLFNAEFRDPKYRPHIIFSTMIRAGHYGRKSGKGFYDYQS